MNNVKIIAISLLLIFVLSCDEDNSMKNTDENVFNAEVIREKVACYTHFVKIKSNIADGEWLEDCAYCARIGAT